MSESNIHPSIYNNMILPPLVRSDASEPWSMEQLRALNEHLLLWRREGRDGVQRKLDELGWPGLDDDRLAQLSGMEPEQALEHLHIHAMVCLDKAASREGLDTLQRLEGAFRGFAHAGNLRWESEAYVWRQLVELRNIESMTARQLGHPESFELETLPADLSALQQFMSSHREEFKQARSMWKALNNAAEQLRALHTRHQPRLQEEEHVDLAEVIELTPWVDKFTRWHNGNELSSSFARVARSGIGVGFVESLAPPRSGVSHRMKISALPPEHFTNSREHVQFMLEGLEDYDWLDSVFVNGTYGATRDGSCLTLGPIKGFNEQIQLAQAIQQAYNEAFLLPWLERVPIKPWDVKDFSAFTFEPTRAEQARELFMYSGQERGPIEGWGEYFYELQIEGDKEWLNIRSEQLKGADVRGLIFHTPTGFEQELLFNQDGDTLLARVRLETPHPLTLILWSEPHE